ncbi:PadR family transcriptional regulator [Gordonia sp. ABSL1-1]|uniref:PadR family transcriptional regulator n=1 Tax=Gordonia sp. ABSL1-1 TaxID=3053923 RepID=UPI0025738757|nr:PadR family transcriptional regulator [Gordonia sp. ABSL1-1]MDL9935941.1 PadR family transcriptional regulator [Gordonia sp. ABSL1-1]
MSLRHAILAALLDGEASGYHLAKNFDVSVASYWFATPQQLYAELTRLETAGLITGREVVQQRRPNKRMFTITEAGMSALHDFVASASRPTFIRDELLVQVYACDAGDAAKLAGHLQERAAQAIAKAELIEKLLAKLRGERSEDRYLAEAVRVGPYLTGLRGSTFERENAAWCHRVASVLRLRANLAAETVD